MVVQNIRRRLDQLGYRQPLGIESIPLVERLFSDLVHTTESLKNIKVGALTVPAKCTAFTRRLG